MRKHQNAVITAAFIILLIVSPGAAQTPSVSFLYQGLQSSRGQLLLSPSGALYGTTAMGGLSTAGTVFELSPTGAGGVWSYTELFDFNGNTGGSRPMAGLVMDKAGNLYGTTTLGGFAVHAGYGTVFRLTPPAASGETWRETVLHSFRGQPAGDGANPYGWLVFSQNGTLYGTTYSGGAANAGTIFELAPPSTVGGPWTETIIHSFGLQADGVGPRAGPIMDKSGNLYGTTQAGGTYGFGTVWRLAPATTSGGPWTETVLYSFAGPVGGDGASPYGGLNLASNGIIYGTTYSGGVSGSGPCSSPFPGGCGTVFALAPPSSPGGSWTETVIYSFTGQNGDGIAPAAGVSFGPNGVLYGTTEYGGDQDGSIFMLTPPAMATGAWTEAVIYGLSSYANAYPSAALTPSSSGILYGTSCCAVFEIHP
jgi:uncharacterized repeat protein (TIGR03803 family)